MSSWTEQPHETGLRPVFHGRAGTMFPVVLKGLVLTILTLGVYRFWYLTDVRRFLWNHVEIEGDYLEYTGRGVELFIGFLIALAVVAPLYGAFFLIGVALGPLGAAIAQQIATIAVIFLAQFALFRARRYRLTRTIWRGVRFQQTGSGLAYAAISVGWGLVAIVTLGLAYPWMRASLERYKMTNTWYGDQQGAFSATGGALFRRGVLLWLFAVAIVPGAIFGAAFWAGAATFGQAADPNAANAMARVAGIVIFGLVVLVCLVPIYLAIEYRWWANGCAVGAASARCDLGALQFLKVYAGYAGIALLFAIVAGGAVGLLGYTLDLNRVFQTPEPDLAQYAVMATGVLVYFVLALTFAALWQLFGVRPIWRKSFESVEIHGLTALTAAQSAAPPASAFGEGIADAIDFGGF